MGLFENKLSKELREKMDWYLGEHPIINGQYRAANRPNNTIVDNLPYANVDTFNGYFIGRAPQITLDDTAANEGLQDWLNQNSFQDKLAEVSKRVDIYGRAYMLVYQNEESQTRVALANPETSFMIYDDTVEQQPLAFVRVTHDRDQITGGTLYTKDGNYQFDKSGRLTEDVGEPNLYRMVSAVEFISNTERQGLNDQIFGLADALDRALSQKANQVEYFDNAYLSVLGINLENDEDEDDGEPLDIGGSQLIYSPDPESANAVVKFLEKPDGDNMQEHLINRLLEQNYNITGIVNFNDSRITGNMTGKALERLLQRMSNRAVFKRTKFTEALRHLFAIVFSAGTITGISKDDWSKLDFKFYENLPADYGDEANAAKALEGIVSKETQLKVLQSIVPDPKAEIQRMEEEKAAQIANAVKASGTLPDAEIPDDEKQVKDDGDEPDGE